METITESEKAVGKRERRNLANVHRSRLLHANIHVLYLFLAPALLLTLVFGYIPMFSNIVAFMDYKITNPMFGLASPFVGFKWFSFLKELWFYQVAGRTVLYSFVTLLFGFPASLILALLFNELRNQTFKKMVQTVSYIPNFVSWVTAAGLVYLFLTVDPTGLVNNIVQFIFHLPRHSFMQDPNAFLPVLVVTGVWKNTGWGTILYMAALSTIDEQIYEAAEVDGANRWNKLLHITFPGLIPTFCLLLIFALGGLFSVNFDQVFNLQNSVLRQDVMNINLYTYYNGIVNGDYSISTAVGLFQGVVSFILIYSVNKVTRKLADTGIF